jgi:hypothetical protein
MWWLYNNSKDAFIPLGFLLRKIWYLYYVHIYCSISLLAFFLCADIKLTYFASTLTRHHYRITMLWLWLWSLPLEQQTYKLYLLSFWCREGQYSYFIYKFTFFISSFTPMGAILTLI